MKILLYAAGGHGRSVYEIIKNLNLNVVAYAELTKVSWLKNTTLIKDLDIETLPSNVKVANGLGGVNPKNLIKRLKIINKISKNREVIRLIDKTAFVSNECIIEEGCVIMPGAIIRAGALIKKHSIINSGAIIEHDVTIGPGSHIAPGATLLGSVECGNCCTIGTRSIITQKNRLASNTFIRAGKVI